MGRSVCIAFSFHQRYLFISVMLSNLYIPFHTFSDQRALGMSMRVERASLEQVGLRSIYLGFRILFEFCHYLVSIVCSVDAR